MFLVLGSTSSARKTLLDRLGVPYKTFNPNIDESPRMHENGELLVGRLSKEKAEKTALAFPDAIIIAADTVGEVNGTLLNKPLSHEDAVRQLQLCQNQRVSFFTGLCVLNSKTKNKHLAVESMAVTFRSLSTEEINRYLELEKPYHCAGSIKAEGLAIRLIKEFSGTDFSTLIGLPLIRLVDFLLAENIDVLNYKYY